MPLKFTDVFSKTDWIKITILVIVALICWVWVYSEYQKPFAVVDIDQMVVEPK